MNSSLCFSRGCSRKKGSLGEGVMMMMRILIVVFIAFVIFGIASIFYTQYIGVRSAEASLMGRSVVNCLAPKGVFSLDDYPEDEFDKLLSHCGFDGADYSRLFVRVVFSEGDKELARMYQGDSGTLWVRELYKEGAKAKLSGDVEQYEPGYLNESYNVFFESDGARLDADMNVEVLVQHE